MADNKDDEIRELRERLARLETAQPAAAPPPPPVQAPPKKSGCANAIVAILVLFALLIVIGTCSQDGGSPGSPNSLTATENAWSPPAGYDRHVSSRGGGIGVQWEQPTRAECRGSGVTCFAVNVVTERDCARSLYMSITLLDDGNRNIGWTNDTAQGVQAGDQVRLVFDTHENGVTSAQVAEISCY